MERPTVRQQENDNWGLVAPSGTWYPRTYATKEEAEFAATAIVEESNKATVDAAERIAKMRPKLDGASPTGSSTPK